MLIAHTPDADDAFAFYGMLNGKIATKMRVEHVVDDIEALNRRAFGGEIDVTALSVHAYAFLHSQYRILSAGASVGNGYGWWWVGRDMELSVSHSIGLRSNATMLFGHIEQPADRTTHLLKL